MTDRLRQGSLLQIALPGLEVARDKILQKGNARLIEHELCRQDLGQRPFLGVSPRLERSDELNLIDQPILKCEQTEKEISRGVGIGAASHASSSRLCRLRANPERKS